jgi:hypothetical protein
MQCIFLDIYRQGLETNWFMPFGRKGIENGEKGARFIATVLT